MTALIITYYWPPASGSGIQRWMYFAKYLEELGVKPIVLTVKPGKASYREIDKTLSDHVSHVDAYRTNTREPLKMYSFLRSGSTRKAIPQGHVGEKRSPIGMLGNFIRSNFYIPDARVGWKKFALREARKIVAKHTPNVVITTGPPHSTHLIGLQLKKEFGAKWLADFRDPWSELYYNKELNRFGFASRKDQRLEHEVLKQADMVLSVGPSLTRLLAAKLVPNEDDKFHHILNGYDAHRMEKLSRQRNDKFTMTFIGLLTAHQPFGSIINALKKASENQSDFASKTQLVFAGTIENNIIRMCQQVADLEVVNHGRVIHTESLQLMVNANLLLNCLPETDEAKLFITGKMMEYLATGIPVMSVGPIDGDAAGLLSETSNSRMFSKYDEGGMANFIELVFDRWSSGTDYQNVHMERLGRYSRYETTRQVAELIKSM